MRQQMLKLLPSWPNVLSTTAEDVVYYLEFFPGNCWNLSADGDYELLQGVRIFLYTWSFKLPGGVKSGESRKPKTVPNSRPCKFSGTVFKCECNLAVDSKRLALWFIRFVTHKWTSVLQRFNSLPWLKYSVEHCIIYNTYLHSLIILEQNGSVWSASSFWRLCPVGES